MTAVNPHLARSGVETRDVSPLLNDVAHIITVSTTTLTAGSGGGSASTAAPETSSALSVPVGLWVSCLKFPIKMTLVYAASINSMR